MIADYVTCNIICQNDIVRSNDVYEISSWGIRAILSEGPLDFVMKKNRYILDTRRPVRITFKEFQNMWQERLVELGHRKAVCYATNKTVKGEAARYTVQER